MRKSFLFLLSGTVLFTMAAYQARIETPEDMVARALAPRVIEVEELR